MATTTNNNLSAYIANTSVVNSAFFFRTFQDTVVRSMNLLIRTIVPPNISVEIFRIAIIAILFIRQILSLSSSLSIFFSNMTVPVVVYFLLPTGSAARATERIVDSIRPVFYIDNLQGIEFLDFPINQRWYRI